MQVVKLESISIQLVAVKPATGGEPAETLQQEAPMELVRLGRNLSATVKLDKTQRGQLKGVEVELTVPSLLLSVDIHSAKCLCAAITTYLALTSPESPKPGANQTGRSGKAGADVSAAQATTKSIMQKVLMSDPTLRILFWLEEEENRKKRAGGKAVRMHDVKGAAAGDDIDFARVAQLMRQVSALFGPLLNNTASLDVI
jgi:hypothetical protein